MDGASTRPHFAEISTAFPTVPESVAAARRFVAASLRRFEFTDATIEHAILATSELVANAFAAGRPPIRIRVRLVSDGRATIEITHGADSEATEPGSVDEEPHLTAAGRAVVESMVTRWGSRAVGGGVMAWFEIDDAALDRAEAQASTSGGA